MLFRSAPPAHECCQRELDVLAGAQLVGGVIGTGAVVIARIQPAYRHAVGAARFRVAHLEFGEKRFGTQVLQRELLLAPELAAQRALPFSWIHLFGAMGAGILRSAISALGLSWFGFQPWCPHSHSIVAGGLLEIS